MLGVFVGGSSFLDPATKQPRFRFDVVDLDRDVRQSIPLSFLAHGFTTMPKMPHVAAVFEKRGPGAALLDLATMKRIAEVRCKPTRAYYGHGVFNRLDDSLLVVETELESGRGVVSVRETTSYREVDAFPTHGDRPHDCLPIDDGKVLVFTNGGGAIGEGEPSVTYVDVASRKLLERVTFSDPKINAGHVVISKAGDLAIVSAPRQGLAPFTAAGGVHLRSKKRKPTRMRAAPAVMDKIIGESLSVAIHEPTNVASVTNPFGGIVTFWSLGKQKLVGSLSCESPRGIEISRDGAYFIVAFGKNATLMLVDATTLQPVERTFCAQQFSGSHIFPWNGVAIDVI